MKGNISIGRDSRNSINIEIQDEASRINFLKVKMTPEQFAMVLTGLSMVNVDFEVKGLSKVGLTKVIESRKVSCPISSYDRKILSQWLVENCQEEGWKIDTYLGSQRSITYENGITFLNYKVYRYE